MPCYTTTTVTHAVEKWDAERALQAIKEAGVSVQYANGKLTAYTEADITKVKQKYAELTLKTAAKKFGWSIKSESTTKTGLVQIGLTRR
jgi:hypothetical protein